MQTKQWATCWQFSCKWEIWSGKFEIAHLNTLELAINDNLGHQKFVLNRGLIILKQNEIPSTISRDKEGSQLKIDLMFIDVVFQRK